MNTRDLILPWFVSQLWILGIFVLSLAVFHFLFFRLAPLSSIGWKRIDYVWLSMALLGLMGAVAAGREIIATNMVEYSKSRIEWSFRFMRLRAEYGTSNAICRTFVRSEFSPPSSEMERDQKEYDDQCRWFKNVNAVISTFNVNKQEEVDPISSFGKPPLGGDEWARNSFLESVENYNSIVRAIGELDNAIRPTGFELFLKILGPTLIAIALALRITKVAGEIYNERKKRSG
jgi:hypothetical protein